MECSKGEVRIGHRIIWIDVARFIAMVSVALQHCCGVAYASNSVLNCGAVALFFVLAGYFSVSKSTGWLDWKRCRLFLVPYVLWNIIAFVMVNIVAFVLFNNVGMRGVGDVFANLWEALTRQPLPCNAALWFLRDLMLYVLFVPLFRRLSKSVLVAVILGLLVSAYLLDPNARMFEGLSLGDGIRVPNWRGCGFFCMGILLSQIPLGELRGFLFGKRRYSVTLASVLLVPLVACAGWIYYLILSDMILLASCYGLLGFACLIEDMLPSVARWMARFGPSIFLFYAVHGPVFRCFHLLYIKCFGVVYLPFWLPWLMIPAFFIVCSWCYYACRRFAPFMLPLFMGHPRPIRKV